MRVTQFVSICEQTAAINIDDDSCHKAVAHEFQRERSDVFGAANASHKGAFCRSCEHFRTPVGGHSGIDGRISYAGEITLTRMGASSTARARPNASTAAFMAARLANPAEGRRLKIPEKSVMEPLERICA